jgi:ribosomal protein S14
MTLKPRERQQAWAEIEEFMTSFPHRVNRIYQYAEMIGFPAGDDGRSGNAVSDRTANLAVKLASGRIEDPSVEVARKLDKWLITLRNETRHLDHEIRRCEPEKKVEIRDLDRCEICDKPRSITKAMVLGKCRTCYDKTRYDMIKRK